MRNNNPGIDASARVADAETEAAGALPTVATTATATDAPRRPRRGRTAGSWDIMPGKRAMKGYPMTEDGLQMLTFMDGGAAILLALATTSGTVWFDISKDLALASGSPAAATAFYDGIRTVCGWASLAFFILTGAVVYFRGNYLTKIKSETQFDD